MTKDKFLEVEPKQKVEDVRKNWHCIDSETKLSAIKCTFFYTTSAILEQSTMELAGDFQFPINSIDLLRLIEDSSLRLFSYVI